MGGCTNCGAKAGCEHRKGDMLTAVAETLRALYPTNTWGEPDDLARFGAGIDEDDGHALAEEFARELDASTFFRPGDVDEYCDYIYILCVGREPCLVQIRDGEVAVPDEIAGDPSATIREQYLRVCLSQMTRMAGVQQTALALDPVDGGYIVSEEPRSGVYDAPLLRRFQRLVTLFPAYDIVHLDFGEISAPPPGYAAGDYAARFGGAPHTANYLFYPQPSNMKTSCFIPA